MATTASIDIAIIGAGMGGLAAAAALRRLGMRSTIYEQAAAFARVGAGIQLTPNALKVMRGLGLENRLRAVSFAPQVGYNRVWSTGEVTYLHPMGAEIESRYGAPDLSMQRTELHAALLSSVEPGSIRLGHKLAGIERVRDDRVRLSFANGSSGTADAVIGADGIHSVVRSAIHGEDQAEYTGQVAYRAVYRSERIGRPVDDRVKWWGEGRHIVSYKVDPRGEEIYFIASTPEPDLEIESWSAIGDRSRLLEAYAGFHPDARILLEAAPEVRRWPLLGREPLERWSEGRVMLIGDAAHPMLPTMAQGAGSAMEDAVVLARCLVEFASDGVAEAFRRCERLRRERTTRFQLDSRRNLWMQTRAVTPTDWVYDYDAWQVPLT